MATATNYSGYNQTAAQPAYGSYAAAQPAQGYGQTAQQGYTQQDYSSYAQPAATDSAYGQTATSTSGYAQPQYPASYGQSAAPTAYGTPQAGAQGYTQAAQGYGAGSYANATAAAPAPASYGTQAGYSAQTAYSGYGQQAASTPQGYSGSSQSYTQGAYPQQQGSYQAQQPAYGGQQQTAYGQGPPQQTAGTAYSAQSNGSYGQPGQYSQPGAAPSTYDQSGHYGGYSQGGAYGGSQPPQRGGYHGENAGRDGFDRMRGGPRGRGPMGRGGMGMAGDRGGFSKPGGPGVDREMGGEQDDSENCAIYITGLTEKATVEEMAEFFKHVGAIRMNRRLGHQAINIYTDRDSGKPKGDATLSYEDPQCARAAVEYFNGKEFQGRKLNVSMARRKNPPGMMRGGMPMRGGPMDRGGMMGRGADRGGFPPRGGPRGGMPWGGPPGGGNMPKRVGDWECASPGCGNQNFAWRTECNQCKAPRPEGMGPPPGAERGRGGMGRGGRGMPGERGGPGGMRGGWGGEPGGFRGGRGGMDHGGFRGGSRGGPPMDRGARRGMGPGKMDMREGRPDRRDRPY